MRICRALLQILWLFCGYTGLFCGYAGLFCGYTGLFCGYTGLFCGYIGLFCGYTSYDDEEAVHALLRAARVTGWRRLVGPPKLQIIFHKRATKYRSLLRGMTYKDKGSYESSPPCILQGLLRGLHLRSSTPQTSPPAPREQPRTTGGCGKKGPWHFLLNVCGSFVSLCRARSSVCMAVWSVFRPLLSVFRPLLSRCRAFLSVCRALLSVCMAVWLIECV